MSYGSYENHAINIRRDINKDYKDKLKRAGELDYALRVAYDVMEKSDLVNVSVSYWTYQDSVYIHTYVDSFEEANSLIHSLSTGYGREFKKRADARLEKASAMVRHDHGDIKVSVWLNSNSPTCRKVQVGVKHVEQPIYEIQCDD